MTPGLFITLLAVAVALLTAVGFDSVAPTSCSDARESLAHGATAQAEKRYRAILTGEPGSACAAAGFTRVIARYCVEARQRADEGLLADAEKRYGAVLDLRPKERCAHRGLRLVSLRLCAAADRLRLADADDEAKKAYQALLNKPHAAVVCALAGLAALDAKQPKAKETTKS